MRVWVIRKNCSLTPAQTVFGFVAASVVIVGIGLAFAVMGHWPVLLFAFVEVALLAALLLRYCRHATDHERLSLAHDVLCVEITVCDATTRRNLVASLVRFELDGATPGIVLRYGNEVLVVGRMLCPPARRRLAETLRQCCRHPLTPDDERAAAPAIEVVSNVPAAGPAGPDR